MSIEILAHGHTKAQYLRRDWGLSLLVNRHILFDTYSRPAALFDGLARVGVQPVQIDTVVISHDHWDHTGGLDAFLKERAAAGGEALRLFHPRDPFPSDAPFLELSSGVYLLRPLPFAFKGETLCEQALVLDQPAGLQLIVGCSHPGIDHMVSAAKAAFHRPVVSLCGGLHLMNAPDDAVAVLADKLKALGVQQIEPMHCTGAHATEELKKAFA